MFSLLLGSSYFFLKFKPQSSCKVCSNKNNSIVHFIIVWLGFAIDKFCLAIPIASSLLTQDELKLQKNAAVLT